MTSSRRGRMVWPLRHDDVSRTVGRSRDRDAPAEPPLRRALALGVGLQLLQQLVGINTVMYYSTTILEASHDDVSQQDWLAPPLDRHRRDIGVHGASGSLAPPPGSTQHRLTYGSGKGGTAAAPTWTKPVARKPGRGGGGLGDGHGLLLTADGQPMPPSEALAELEKSKPRAEVG